MEGWRQIGGESSREPNDESGDKQHDDPFNWLGRNNSLLTSTGLLMEGLNCQRTGAQVTSTVCRHLGKVTAKAELLSQRRQRGIGMRGAGGNADSQCADLSAGRSVELDSAANVRGRPDICRFPA